MIIVLYVCSTSSTLNDLHVDSVPLTVYHDRHIKRNLSILYYKCECEMNLACGSQLNIPVEAR